MQEPLQELQETAGRAYSTSLDWRAVSPHMEEEDALCNTADALREVIEDIEED